MAKQCIYCGEPLPKEDARFCKGCGRSQFPSSAGAAATPSPIKVKLAPKEISREDLSFPRQESSQPGPLPGASRSLQREQPPQQPSRLPKRPVRFTAQETQAGGEKPKVAKDSLPALARPVASTPAKTSPPAPAEEESSMVLPGWRKELEQLRKEKMADSPLTAEKKSDGIAQGALASSQRSPSAPLTSRKAPDLLARAREKTASERLSASRVPEPPARPSEPPRSELRVKVWEQEPTVQMPQVREEKQEPGPAPAIEQTPFASVPFELEDQNKQSADLATTRWQTPLPSPPQDEESGAQLEKQRPADAFEEIEQKDEVEDLPTVPLAVPQTVKNQPQITIERSSTPAPKKWNAPAAEDDIEDLPTRPMAAASAKPRSPLPPVAQQAPANLDQVAGRPASPQRPPAAQPMNAAKAPDAAFESSSPGQRSGNPPAQLGSTFDPASMPPLPRNPVSLSGNATPWPETPQAPQRPPSFASASPLPSTPRPDSTALSDALSRAHKKKRVSGKLVAILLVLLLVAGGGAFLAYYQLSSGGAVLQPHQSYQVTALGVSLSYPQHWTAQVDQAHNVVHFADSSQTGQINLSRADANGQTLNQYLNQQTTQMGITAPQVDPAVTFAGSSWQQVQGNVTQKGATYMAVLYVTQRTGRFYALTCLSPLTAYSQMETDDFAPLRASFKFL